MAKFLYFLLSLPIILTGSFIFSSPAYAACTTVSFRFSPDTGSYVPSLASEFRIVVSGLKANNYYGIDVRDDKGGAVISVTHKSTVQTEGFDNPQRTSNTATELWFGPFNTKARPWNVDVNRGYTVIAYDFGDRSDFRVGPGGAEKCTPSQNFRFTNTPYTGEVETPGSGQSSTSQGGGFGGTEYCDDKKTKGVQTALGCLPSDPGKLVGALFGIILGFAGSIAVIMIILGGFKVAMSQGNPDALQDGKDTITHAILGLVFILLATVILGIIGIDILGLKNFVRDGTGIIINQ